MGRDLAGLGAAIAGNGGQWWWGWWRLWFRLVTGGVPIEWKWEGRGNAGAREKPMATFFFVRRGWTHFLPLFITIRLSCETTLPSRWGGR